jgi:hypothetical protein
MTALQLKPRLSRDGSLTTTDDGWRLGLRAGPGGSYRLSQLDDQRGRPRHAYAWQPPVSLQLRARISGSSLPGTWGFGFWNDPYGFSWGPGEMIPRLPALPRALWFFGASEKSYLSFRDDQPANGFLAQVFSNQGFKPALIKAALALPFAPRTSRRILSGVILEEAAHVDINPADWHAYRLQWNTTQSVFAVDGTPILRTTLSPPGPLGLVIWIDNQYAAFDPKGRIRWGSEPSPSDAWMEIEDLELQAETGRG